MHQNGSFPAADRPTQHGPRLPTIRSYPYWRPIVSCCYSRRGRPGWGLHESGASVLETGLNLFHPAHSKDTVKNAETPCRPATWGQGLCGAGRHHDGADSPQATPAGAPFWRTGPAAGGLGQGMARSLPVRFKLVGKGLSATSAAPGNSARQGRIPSPGARQATAAFERGNSLCRSSSATRPVTRRPARRS